MTDKSSNVAELLRNCRAEIQPNIEYQRYQSDAGRMAALVGRIDAFLSSSPAIAQAADMGELVSGKSLDWLIGHASVSVSLVLHEAGIADTDDELSSKLTEAVLNDEYVQAALRAQPPADTPPIAGSALERVARDLIAHAPDFAGSDCVTLNKSHLRALQAALAHIDSMKENKDG
jgi:hypothetical protein